MAVLNKEVYKMDIQGYIDDVNALNDYIRLAIAFGLIFRFWTKHILSF